MRDDFPKGVVETLAKRVGNRCSNPACRKLTSGPHTEDSKALNVGVAAHITAASQGGPRYDSSLTSVQRRAISNGIWLCQSCAKLIDNDEVRYTKKQLVDWKLQAEAESLREIESARKSTESASAFRWMNQYWLMYVCVTAVILTGATVFHFRKAPTNPMTSFPVSGKAAIGEVIISDIGFGYKEYSQYYQPLVRGLQPSTAEADLSSTPLEHVPLGNVAPTESNYRKWFSLDFHNRALSHRATATDRDLNWQYNFTFEEIFSFTATSNQDAEFTGVELEILSFVAPPPYPSSFAAGRVNTPLPTMVIELEAKSLASFPWTFKPKYVLDDPARIKVRDGSEFVVPMRKEIPQRFSVAVVAEDPGRYSYTASAKFKLRSGETKIIPIFRLARICNFETSTHLLQNGITYPMLWDFGISRNSRRIWANDFEFDSDSAGEVSDLLLSTDNLREVYRFERACMEDARIPTASGEALVLANSSVIARVPTSSLSFVWQEGAATLHEEQIPVRRAFDVLQATRTQNHKIQFVLFHDPSRNDHEWRQSSYIGRPIETTTTTTESPAPKSK